MSLILSATNDKVEMVTSGTADVDWSTHYVIADKTSSPMVVKDANNNDGSSNLAQTNDISGSPAGSNDRWVITQIEARNRHASSSNDVTFRHVKAAGTARELFKCTLFAGWSVKRNAQGTWFVFDDKGGVVQTASAASDTLPGLIQIAVQSDMEAASSNVLAVPPGRQHFHPGMAKCWWRVTVSAGTPTLANSYNITSITDTGTGQLTVTIATDFSGVNYAPVTAVERASTTMTVANCRNDTIRNATPAAGSLQHECYDQTATTAALVDPATWYGACFGDQ